MTVYDHQKPVTGPLSFRHFYVVEYRPGEDELINYRAKKRKNGAMYESVEPCPCDDCGCNPCRCGEVVNEAAPVAGAIVRGAIKRMAVRSAASKAASNDKAEVDEALTMAQRQKRARIMKRLKSRIKIGRERQKRRMADKGRLEKRAIKQAKNKVIKKILKGKQKRDLSFARRQEIEKRIEKPAVKKRIERLAKRMFPSIRRAEVQRKKG